jgi:PKHD-type hydroxylase
MVSIPIPVKKNKFMMTPVVLENRFSKEECTKIVEDTINSEKYLKGLELNSDKKFGVNIKINEGNSWIASRIAEIFIEVNSSFYHFEISNISEINFLRYINEGLDWHNDNRDKDKYSKDRNLLQECRTRKMTMSVLLSSPDDFEGGKLEFIPDFEFSASQGSVVVYPAYVVHRVTPIKTGARYILIASAKGPTFR